METGVHPSIAVERERQLIAVSRDADRREQAHSDVPAPGSVFAFLPAHSGSRAGAVAQQLSRTLSEGLGVTVLLADFHRRAYSVWSATETPKRLDKRSWGAFVSEVDGIQVLNAREVKSRQLRRLVEYARDHFQVICADLTGAQDSHAIEILRAADSVFLVTGSDQPSLEGVRETMDWLRSQNLADQCGLLLEHAAHGASAVEAEERTGVPVCSLVENATQITRLATWLAVSALEQRADATAELALAV